MNSSNSSLHWLRLNNPAGRTFESQSQGKPCDWSPSTTSLCLPHTTSPKINRAISEYTSDKLILSRAISTPEDFSYGSNADKPVWSDSGLDPEQLIAFILLDIIYGWYWSLCTSLENCYERNDMIMWQEIKRIVMLRSDKLIVLDRERERCCRALFQLWSVSGLQGTDCVQHLENQCWE